MEIILSFVGFTLISQIEKYVHYDCILYNSGLFDLYGNNDNTVCCPNDVSLS